MYQLLEIYLPKRTLATHDLRQLSGASKEILKLQTRWEETTQCETKDCTNHAKWRSYNINSKTTHAYTCHEHAIQQLENSMNHYTIHTQEAPILTPMMSPLTCLGIKNSKTPWLEPMTALCIAWKRNDWVSLGFRNHETTKTCYVLEGSIIQKTFPEPQWKATNIPQIRLQMSLA